MHSKIKGNIGQLGIGLELSKLGYSVFTEEGDISKIDIIAEKNGKLIRIQSKAVTPMNGCITLLLTKSGPNYKFRYEADMFDYFGLWDLEEHKAYLIPVSVLETNKKSFKLRKEDPKNNQTANIRMASDYLLADVLS